MKKLTLRNYLGYTAGDLANNLAFSSQALFLLIYYTNVVGLDPAAIATMFLVVRPGTPSPTSPQVGWSTSPGPAGGSSGRTCFRAPFRSCCRASPCSASPIRQHDRQVRLRLRHLRPAGLPLLADQHSVRLLGHGDDPGPGRALPPRHLAIDGTDLRHVRPCAGDRPSDHPVQDPTRPAANILDDGNDCVRRPRLRPLPVLLRQLQGAGLPRGKAGHGQGDRRHRQAEPAVADLVRVQPDLPHRHLRAAGVPGLLRGLHPWQLDSADLDGFGDIGGHLRGRCRLCPVSLPGSARRRRS